MSKNSTQRTHIVGPGFFGLCFLILMTLKLTGHIVWSWWLIFAVLFAPLMVTLVLSLFLFLFSLFQTNRKR